MQYSIFKCDMDMLSSLTEFYLGVTTYLDSHINYPKWTPGVYPGEESIRMAINAGTQYVCMAGDELVGAFIYNADPQGAYEKGDWEVNLSEGEYAVIHSLAVSDSHYGEGIGTKMVQFCIDKARNGGYKAVRLDIVPENIPARKLYEKSGFKFAGEKDLDRGFEDIPTFQLFELNF
jgi:ribosomal protein S18 acetylase RimI-like enzyme